MNTNINYSEIMKLNAALDILEIPHDFHAHPTGFGGFRIAYPNQENCKCSIILFPYSYDSAFGKLEIMGLLTPEEEKVDSVVGGLSAIEVLKRIIEDYSQHKNEIE